MKIEQTDDIFLVINEETEQVITYAKTGTEAAELAGCPAWDWVLQANAINALHAGDELNISPTASVIRLSGLQIDFEK